MIPDSARPNLSAFLCLKGWVIACLVIGWNLLNVCAMWINGWAESYKEPKTFLVLSLAGALGASFMFLVVFSSSFGTWVKAPLRTCRYHRTSFLFMGSLLGLFAFVMLMAGIVGPI